MTVVFRTAAYVMALCITSTCFDAEVHAQSSELSASQELILKLASPPLTLTKNSVVSLQYSHPRVHVVLLAAGDYRAESIFPLSSSPLLNHYVLVRTVGTPAQLANALDQLLAIPEIEAVQRNQVLRLDETSQIYGENVEVPNDSLFELQWALTTIGAKSAWEKTTGSRDVLIAVIDTGVELNHPDLQANLWINSREDLNGNGQIDSTDFNGLDDDDNGFADDLIGWDFTDAPSFPDGGDYLERDWDPSDENGHGTAVTGIIGAVANNRIGIAGLASGCRVMVLRAGTSQGLLEEDDVAAAIVYAVEQGAQIINMSFGDMVVSPMLRDVISYAHSRNVVMVASAGNSASNLPHYPSGFAETIAVGASDANDALATFSNYGTTIDLVAPGTQIWTTKIGKAYAQFAGTSASAPFVSAAAALLCSLHPDWHVETVRAALQNSAADLGTTGWDRFFGAGRLEVAKAVRVERVARSEIHFPRADMGFAPITGSESAVVIRGTVLGAFVERYELSYGIGDAPDEWITISTAQRRQVLADSLAQWQLGGLPDTTYTLRLTALQAGGPAVEDKVRIYLDRTPPQISDVVVLDMIDGNRHSALIEFATDDLSKATLWWRPRGAGDFAALPLNFVTNLHRTNFSSTLANGALEFYLEVANRAGLTAMDDNSGRYYQMQLDQSTVDLWSLAEVPFAAEPPPAGLLLNRVADFDSDGNYELIHSPYTESGGIGKLTILELLGDLTQTVFATPHPAIPRDFGDSDGDGKMEVLMGIGPISMLYEAPAPGAFPSQIVWADSNDFWAARLADLDDDGRGEIIGRVEDLFTVWESAGDNFFTKVAELPNPTNGSNFAGVPHVEIADFDGDGRQEILCGDYDGDIYLYETRGDNDFVHIWNDSLPLIDSIDFIRAGDFDGDGVQDFAAGCHSSPELNAEHEFDGRYWLYRIYRNRGDNDFEVLWEQRFFGFQSPKDFDAGVGAGDFDGDGRDELFINVFPDGYLVDYANGAMQVVWHISPVRSNTTVVTPASLFAPARFYYADGQIVRAMQAPDAQSGPLPPIDLTATPRNDREISLSWQAVAGANGYLVFRGEGEGGLAELAIVSMPAFVDSVLVPEQLYKYAVATIDSASMPAVGSPSRTVSVRPSAPPRVLQAAFAPPHHIAVWFNEPIAAEARFNARVALERVEPGSEPRMQYAPESIALVHDGTELLLGFPQVGFDAGEYSIAVANVFDLNRVPLDTAFSVSQFRVAAAPARFYLTTAELVNPKQVLLRFNLPVEVASATRLSNYDLTIADSVALKPSLASVEIPADDPAAVRLQLQTGLIAPLGLRYVIAVRGVVSREGIAMQPGEGDVVGFAPVAENLQHLVIYPNPYLPARHQRLIIGGLTSAALIRILDEHGRTMTTLTESDGDGGRSWDGNDSRGMPAPSGVYICHVSNGTETVMKKFVLVR